MFKKRKMRIDMTSVNGAAKREKFEKLHFPKNDKFK